MQIYIFPLNNSKYNHIFVKSVRVTWNAMNYCIKHCCQIMDKKLLFYNLIYFFLNIFQTTLLISYTQPKTIWSFIRSFIYSLIWILSIVKNISSISKIFYWFIKNILENMPSYYKWKTWLFSVRNRLFYFLYEKFWTYNT